MVGVFGIVLLLIGFELLDAFADAHNEEHDE